MLTSQQVLLLTNCSKVPYVLMVLMKLSSYFSINCLNSVLNSLLSNNKQYSIHHY